MRRLPSPIPARQFRSAVPLRVRSGETVEAVQTLRSDTICTYFGLDHPGPAHDACVDAAGVAIALGFLPSHGRLKPADFTIEVLSEKRVSCPAPST